MIDTGALKALGAVRVLSDLVPGLEWKRQGIWHKTRCPFHEEKSASFGVGSTTPHRGRCFSCKAAGDVVELAALVWKVGVPEALQRLAGMYNVPEIESLPPPDPDTYRPSPLGEPDVNPVHAELYERAMRLASLEPVEAYLAGRKVLEAAQTVNAGSPVPLVGGVDGAHVSAWCRAVGKAHPDVWRGAGGGTLWRVGELGLSILLFGTLACTGDHLAGLCVRVLEPPSKEMRYLQVGSSPRPWRAGAVDPTRDLVVCEGAIDALSWHAAGVQALGVLGVETWRPWFARAIPNGTPVVVATDRDNAGRRAQARIAHDLRHLQVRLVDLQIIGPNDANDALQVGIALLEAIKADARPMQGHQVEGPGAPGGPASAGPAPGALPVPEPLDDDSQVEEPAPYMGPQAARGPDTTPPEAALRRKWPAVGLPLHLVDVKQWESLPDLIEWAHWKEKEGKDGDEQLARMPSIQPIHALTDLVIRWIEAHGGVFRRDAEGGAWLYFRGRLHPININDPDWRGWLYEMGRVNLSDREGRCIAAALEQYAQARRDAPPLQPWCHFDRVEMRLALHLHDPNEQVAVVTRSSLTFEENGTNLLLVRDNLTKPFRWEGAPDARSALGDFERLVVSCLATRDRSLVAAWALTALVRQALDTRALLFLGGAAGAGKTEAARLITTLWHGVPRVVQPTVAALWVEGAQQPIVALDNQETAQLSDDLMQWLLLASTGGQRKKRQEGTTSGVVSQRTEALACITAIEPPPLDELIQRTLLCTFEHRLHSGDYRPGAIITELQKARGAIMAGLLKILGEHVLPRSRDVGTYAAMVPSSHPKARLAHHLGMCALWVDVCHELRPGMWGSGQEELKGWLESQGASAHAIAQGTDVVVDALERLLWCHNRVLRDRQGNTLRPAHDEMWFRCKFIYGEGILPGWGAEREVVGFEGGYSDLHADLLRACKETAGGEGFKKRILSASQLSARWQHNRAIADSGWRAELVERHGRTGRCYRFTAANTATRGPE